MNIALLAPLYYPIAEPYRGGLEMHTHLLARELTTAGHRVTLFAHPESDATLNVVPVPLARKTGFWSYGRAIRGALRQVAAGGFDVVHNNAIHFLPPLYARRLPCPVVTTLHTPPYRAFRLTSALARRYPGHHYVAISRHLARRWAGLTGGAAPVIHNGIDTAHWPFSAAGRSRTAFWYGRLSPEKGVEFAVAAARRAGYELDLAGPINDRAYFDRAVAPLLGGAVRYVGHLDQAAIATRLGRAAVALVTPVWDEPFGLVYLEALACGTPVAGFAGGAAAEIITPEVGTLVPRGDIRALAQVLGEVERRKERAACRRRVAEHFPARLMTERYLALYARVAR